MLLRFLLTILALIWIYQALKPYLNSGQKTSFNPPPPPPNRNFNNIGEYTDYEEIDNTSKKQ